MSSEINTSETKAIIWDLDGTILDSPRLMRVLVDELSDQFSLERPADETLASNFHGSLQDTLSNILGVTEQVALNELLSAFLENQQHHYESIEAHLLSDAVDLMQRATEQGLKQVIVTNREHAGRGAASPKEIALQDPLCLHIHAVISGDEYADFRKPDPRIVSQVLRDWSIEQSEVIVIGDQFVDAQLALNLGTRAIIVSRASNELINSNKLPDNWEKNVTLVRSLDDVSFTETT